MLYRRSKTGCTFFFTVNIAQRHLKTLTDNIELLRSTIRSVQSRHPFTFDAIVVLPDHLHTIWTLPENDNDYPMRWSLIKANFSRNLKKAESINASRLRKRERGIWQRRYWEHQIKNDLDMQRHIDYIHYNPVKHGYVKSPVDWPYSSIHRYIKNGLLSKNWAGLEDFGTTDFGE